MSHHYAKAKTYLESVATPELFAQLEAKDYVQLAMAHALVDIACELNEAVQAIRDLNDTVGSR